MKAGIACAVAARNKLGEAPFWCPREQALYWVDIEEKRLQRFDPQSKTVQSWQLPERIGSFALREGGGAVLALEQYHPDWNRQMPVRVMKLLDKANIERVQSA
ncbi:MAG: SMP-30/gluconolactonase/LRE family protein [Acetobacteraceae bacterium]